MYLRNIFAAASFVAMVASAALPQGAAVKAEARDTAWIEGRPEDCVQNCDANGISNMACYDTCTRCNSFTEENCVPRSDLEAKVGNTGA